LTKAIAYIDSTRMVRALSAGIRHLFQRREYIDRINVFPVPDGDTGTNMAFSFKVIHEAVHNRHGLSMKELMKRVADASLDGSRGNSGAIMAQYFHGFSESMGSKAYITASELAAASCAGAKAAWTAMSEPVAGTLPTVLEDFSIALMQKSQQGVDDIRELLEYGLKRARESLAGTPELLPVLKQAGVVDAGGQGFVDLLEGIWTYIDSGETDDAIADLDEILSAGSTVAEMNVGSHRFCTECVIQGKDLDRSLIMKRLEQLDCSSLVVAGGHERVRVHIHVNNPGEAYLACEQFGELHQQKADDMERQHGLMNHTGKVAVVTDSGADIPYEEQERLAIHMVSARLNFGAKEYIDHVSLMPADLYRMLEESKESPKTSQPPIGDFSRQYDLLTGHGYDVMSVGLSETLSGTTQAARSAAERFDGRVRVFDTQSASSGEGILVVIAAEGAQRGMSLDEIESLLTEFRPLTRAFAIPADLSYIVRGGRLPAWVKRLTDFLHVSPLLTEKNGRFRLAGITTGIGAKPSALGKAALRRMRKETTYRILLAHGANPKGAHELRRYILERHTRVHSCHICEAGPALGVHLGPGGLVVGFSPQPDQLG
jgi:DegV family protein with EDD domain